MTRQFKKVFGSKVLFILGILNRWKEKFEWKIARRLISIKKILQFLKLKIRGKNFLLKYFKNKKNIFDSKIWIFSFSILFFPVFSNLFFWNFKNKKFAKDYFKFSLDSVTNPLSWISTTLVIISFLFFNNSFHLNLKFIFATRNK